MLLKKANTITTPTAYSNGFLHSVKPEVVENLLLQSNQFDTTWFNGNTTETSGQSGYDGTNNAWLVTKSAANGYIGQNIMQSGVTTFSVYAKSNDSTYMEFLCDGGVYQFFNLSNGTLGAGSAIDAQIESVGGGWYRCSMSQNASITRVRIYPAEVNTTSGTSGSIYIQDAQLNKGYSAYPYLETTTEAKPSADFTFTRNSSATRVNELGYIEDVTDDIPRINYEGFTYENGLPVPYSGKGHLLLEGQSTNLVNYSEDFSNVYWTKLNLTESSSFLSPSGNDDAYKITENTASGAHTIYSSNIGGLVNGTDYTYSVFVKYDGRQWIRLWGEYGSTSLQAYFDVQNGVIGSKDVGVSSNIEDYGNGWYRICATANTDGTNGRFRIYLSDVDGGFSYQGNGTSGAYIWGAMFEQGHISSCIPTNGTAVTRLGETCNNATHSFPSEGVLYAEIAALANDGTIRYLGMSDGTSNNRVVILYDGTANRIRGIVSGGGTKHFDGFSDGQNVLDFHKVAIRYKDNDYSLWVDGVLAASASSGTAPTGIDRLEFDLNSGGPFYSKSKMVATFPYLSNDEMECLTT